MSGETEKAVWRPFHETIVEVISGSGHSSLGVLTPLVRKTKIPKNHDAIAQVLRERIEYYDLANELDAEGVKIGKALEAVEQQKQEAEAEKRAKVVPQSAPLGGVSLNDMHDFDPDFGPT